MLLKSGKLFNSAARKKLSERVSEETPTVVICGFGRMGQIVAQMLMAENISYVAIDANVDAVVMAREMGYNVIYGESKKKSILFMFMFFIALALTSCASGTTGSSTSNSITFIIIRKDLYKFILFVPVISGNQS